MSKEIKTVGSELLNEIERVSALREQYREIGEAGSFGVMMMTAAINEAKDQVQGADPVAAIRALKVLQEFEG